MTSSSSGWPRRRLMKSPPPIGRSAPPRCMRSEQRRSCNSPLRRRRRRRSIPVSVLTARSLEGGKLGEQRTSVPGTGGGWQRSAELSERSWCSRLSLQTYSAGRADSKLVAARRSWSSSPRSFPREQILALYGAPPGVTAETRGGSGTAGRPRPWPLGRRPRQQVKSSRELPPAPRQIRSESATDSGSRAGGSTRATVALLKCHRVL